MLRYCMAGLFIFFAHTLVFAAPNADFSSTKYKADKSETPLVAVTIWQTFIDANAGSHDLDKAQAELNLWKKRVDDNSEKINGKWIGGDERKKLLEKVQRLTEEAEHFMEADQTLSAVKKFEEIVKLYPNSFGGNFWLGYINLRQEKFEAGLKNLEMAVRLNPASAEATTNYAIALNFRKQHERAVLTAYKAAQLQDTKEIVQNLVNTIAYAPPGMARNNVKIKPAVEAANLLAGKYHIAGPGQWSFVGLRPPTAMGSGESRKPGESTDTPPGVYGNGSGFLVSDDGLILTNKHVAGSADVLIVRLADGTQRQAEKIAVDDDQDLALIKIKSDKKLPFLQLARADEPNPGSECTALGFPLGNMMKLTLQVTPGSVSSVIEGDSASVVVTCKVNPGNSGGPLVDKFGNVIGIVTQKTFSTDFIESYGKAISAGRIREFIDKHSKKHHAKLSPGTDENKAMSTEEIYRKVSPAAVCVMMIRAATAQPESN